jgi:hypothetical protein
VINNWLPKIWTRECKGDRITKWLAPSNQEILACFEIRKFHIRLVKYISQ